MMQRSLFVVVAALAVGGCFLAPSSSDRPDLASLSGPAPYAEGCAGCHAAQTTGRHASSTHAARGIRCGQCHSGPDHPEFSQPVTDARCGGCHQAQYQQTLASMHFETRVQRVLDTDRPARIALRRAGFRLAADGEPRFAGDTRSGVLGGRLCVACHYEEHRLGPATATREIVCTGCHAGRDTHYPGPPTDGTNRCVACHMGRGETVSGQRVNSHRFGIPGTEEKS